MKKKLEWSLTGFVFENLWNPHRDETMPQWTFIPFGIRAEEHKPPHFQTHVWSLGLIFLNFSLDLVVEFEEVNDETES